MLKKIINDAELLLHNILFEIFHNDMRFFPLTPQTFANPITSELSSR